MLGLWTRLNSTGLSMKRSGLSMKGTGFSMKGTGFNMKRTGFSMKGTGFSPYMNSRKIVRALAPEGIPGQTDPLLFFEAD